MFVYMNKINNRQISQEQWFDEIAVRRPDAASAVNSFDNSWIMRSIDELAQATEFNSAILEVGCGDGSSGLAHEIINAGYEYVGIDISSQCIDRLKKRLNNRGNKVFLAAGTVDQNSALIQKLNPQIVIFCQTIHHIQEEDLLKIIRSLSRLLPKPCAVIVLEPNPFYPLWRIMGFYNKDFRWSHERGISRCSKKSIAAAFTENGFTLKKHLYTRLLPLRIMEIANMKKDVLVRVPIIKNISQYQLFVFSSSENL
jgi:2-polyprenyl-3-methyl-5-hydroxy-6-metoxy-1,4-benzoquinol methylase